MGVSTNIYTYYGIKIPYVFEQNAAYEEVYKECDLEILFGEEYIVIGHRLYDSGDFRYGLEGGDNWKEIDLSQLPAYKIESLESFRKWFPGFEYLIKDKPFKLITFTHWH